MGRFRFWYNLMRPRVEYLVSDDISNGREHNKIPAYSFKESDEAPSDYHYVTDHVQEKLIALVDTSFQTMHNCNCTGSCRDGSCFCSSYSNAGRYYNSKGRLSSTYDIANPGVIYECNSACKCNSKTCINSVIQRGTRAKCALFRTRSRGWGVRALEDIKRGTFLGVYSGELITVAESSMRYDDTYLFTLGSNAPKVTLSDVDNDKEEQQQQEQNKINNKIDLVQSSDPSQSHEFVCDAKFYGNFTRFINHSCSPNVTGIRAYTSHYDKRFPHIAFFANQDVAANSELTLNYGDNYWLVKCRRDNIYCLCKQAKCRFNKRTFAETYKNAAVKNKNNNIIANQENQNQTIEGGNEEVE